MSSTIEAQRRLREIPSEVVNIIGNKSFSLEDRQSQLEALRAEQLEHLAALDTHAKALNLSSGGSAANSGEETGMQLGIPSKAFKSPGVRLDLDDQQKMFAAAKSGQNLSLSLKDATQSDATRLQLPAAFGGIVDRIFEPDRILDHIPKTAMSGPAVEFVTHTANTTGIGAPVVTLGSATSGGTFAAGTYFWKLTAQNAGGETLASNEITATLTANQKQAINWTAITGATGYRLYRGTATGAENILVAVIPGQSTATYTDLGGAGTPAFTPTVDRTSVATTIAPGTLYPETTLVTAPTTLYARKIGIFTTLIDELLADFPTFASYVNVELTKQIIDAENLQLLYGDGTGQNLLGLLNVSGTLSIAKQTTDAPLDVLSAGSTLLRNGPTMTAPDLIIMNPSTWNTIRTLKNSQGNYLLGDPAASTAADVWGTPVILTTQMVPGTILMGNFGLATQAYIRQGITMHMTNSADDDFERGKVKVRAEERIALGVVRPTALVVLTGF